MLKAATRLGDKGNRFFWKNHLISIDGDTLRNHGSGIPWQGREKSIANCIQYIGMATRSIVLECRLGFDSRLVL